MYVLNCKNCLRTVSNDYNMNNFFEKVVNVYIHLKQFLNKSFLKKEIIDDYTHFVQFSHKNLFVVYNDLF